MTAPSLAHAADPSFVWRPVLTGPESSSRFDLQDSLSAFAALGRFCLSVFLPLQRPGSKVMLSYSVSLFLS